MGLAISRPSSGSKTFTVKHFAGPVEYDPRGFLDKARDRLEPAVEQIVSSSTMSLVSDLGAVMSPAAMHLSQRSLRGTKRMSLGTSKSQRSLATKFQVSFSLDISFYIT